ncbi:uroporphyrinogen decarboxylase-like isoform X2 [Mangifera indica]|uniref:uroporphyrinogen decarboxylase-like isoform X2 n=1 Tax=Mangifera indica TaxID=29780 RepID=UPI001CFAC222|nr:uroporphyrinogen decarboxylase-like isoform X2 [Mangifera indica]
MPISATLSISSGVTGTLLSVEFQQLGRVEIKLSQKPRKHCIYGHRFPSYKCFWQVPRSRKLKNFKPRELPLHFAYGKDAEDRSLSNLSEDTDEMFDELFKKYGKVVFRGNDQKLPSAEVDDDVESLSYPLLVKAAKGHLVSRPPAWMMRQAGRYMAVYRKLAEKHPSFRERSEMTDLIVQISLQPWEAFRPDGVIVFSDILTPLPAFGVPFDIDEMKGPVIQSPICLEEDLKALHPLDLEKLQFVGESLKILRKEVTSLFLFSFFTFTQTEMRSVIMLQFWALSEHLGQLLHISLKGAQLAHIPP